MNCNKTDLKSIGKRIKKARENCNMKQEDLAEKLYCKRELISYYENGNRYIKTDTLINLSKILNVSADYLLGLVPEPTTDMTLKEVCNFTGLSEKTITMFIELKKLDTERELSRFFENDIGKKFLVSIVEYCDDVKSTAAFRGHLAATDYDPIICEIKKEEEMSDVKPYEVIAYRISRFLQKYFEERAEAILEPVIEFEKKRYEEVMILKNEINDMISKP